MSAEQQLHDAYQEWHRLAHAQRDAIHDGNWNFLRDCQEAVLQIRSRIELLGGRTRVEESCAGRRSAIHALVEGLIEIERQNQIALAARRQKLAAQIDQLGKSRRNLRRIHQTYAGPPLAGLNALLV